MLEKKLMEIPNDIKLVTSQHIFFKVTNESEIHNGFIYKNGLNVLDKPFELHGSCVPGGLYFTNLENINKFYAFGCHLREITLPVDDPNFLIVRDDNKYRANMIILGKKYSLYDLETYNLLGLNPYDNPYISMDYASMLGLIHVLNKWKESGLYLHYTNNAIDFASINNRINVLEWWKLSGLKLKYSNYAIDGITHQNSEVLEWWKHSGLKIKY